jgi:small-conductance mechanosensitive channel
MTKYKRYLVEVRPGNVGERRLDGGGNALLCTGQHPKALENVIVSENPIGDSHAKYEKRLNRQLPATRQDLADVSARLAKLEEASHGQRNDLTLELAHVDLRKWTTDQVNRLDGRSDALASRAAKLEAADQQDKAAHISIAADLHKIRANAESQEIHLTQRLDRHNDCLNKLENPATVPQPAPHVYKRGDFVQVQDGIGSVRHALYVSESYEGKHEVVTSDGKGRIVRNSEIRPARVEVQP